MPSAGGYEGNYNYNVPAPGGYGQGEMAFDDEMDFIEGMDFIEEIYSDDDMESDDDMNPDGGTDSDGGTSSENDTDSEDVILGPGDYGDAGEFPITDDPMGGGGDFSPPAPPPPVEAQGGWVDTRPENLYHSEETEAVGGNPYYKKLPSVWGKTKYSKYSDH